MSAKKPLDTTYGKLTVIGRRKGKVICRCSCGNRTDVITDATSLRAGRAVSCGCRKRDNGIKRRLVVPGKRFGRLCVTARSKRHAVCDCDCGVRRFVTLTASLLSGRTTSCGCRQRDERSKYLAGINKTHGRTDTTEYRIWVDMRRRCTQSQRPDFHRYGGRGISVSEEWYSSFETFLADMGERPKGTSLERRDNEGDYCKENCYWATRAEQSRNTRQNRRLIFCGEEMIVADAARRYGMTKNCLLLRLRSGMSPDEAVTKPVRVKNRRS